MKIKTIALATLLSLFVATPVAAQSFTVRANPSSGNVELGIYADRRDDYYYDNYYRSRRPYPRYRRSHYRRYYRQPGYRRVYYDRAARRYYRIHYNPRTGRYRRVYYRNYYPARRYYRYYNFYR